MLKKGFLLLFLPLLLGQLVSCSAFRSKDNPLDYQKHSQSIPAMSLPNDSTDEANKVEDYYPVPDLPVAAAKGTSQNAGPELKNKAKSNSLIIPPRIQR